MTGPPPVRHVLVIAPQCPEMGLLDGLDDVARALHGSLTHRRGGACTDAPSAGVVSLLHGASLGQARIEAAIRGAARRAGEAGAVLVLALIGHGMTPGQHSTLYLMAGDSRPDVINTAVNVGELLTQALDTPGLAGVIALVDTCHAGGAVPDLKALDAGVRDGATRLSLLMSVGASQTAYGLAFTRGLVQVLRAGIPGAGEYLRPDAVVEAVRDAAPGQDARLVEYHGAQFGERPWLARNARHPHAAGAFLGPVGTEELERALDPLGGTALAPAPPTGVVGLERLRDILRARPPGGSGSREETAWAVRVVDGLLDGVLTLELLGEWPGAPLTSERLRRALLAAGTDSEVRLPGTTGSELLRDAVEFLRLRAPRVGGSRTAPLAAFVAALAAEDSIEPGHPRLHAWARDVGAGVELSDAHEELSRRSDRTRLRLIVSLHAAVADEWPETLDAWLLDRGKQHAHREFTCTPDRSGVERRLAEILRWASAEAKKVGVRLRRVEVAASSALLLRWRPEETDFGMRLGVTYDVVLRWSERLCPPEHLWWINMRAQEKLEAMAAVSAQGGGAGGAPVDWLAEHETGQATELDRRMRLGSYPGAVALAHLPTRFDQVMEVLLAHAPIVLWPDGEAGVPDTSRENLAKYWHLLPAEFSEAYRRSWQEDTPADGRDDLARLRSVWHDPEWLDFCEWFEGSAPPSTPPSTTHVLSATDTRPTTDGE